MADKMDITIVSSNDHLIDYFENIIKCSLNNDIPIDYLNKYPNVQISINKSLFESSFDIKKLNSNLIVYLIDEFDVLNATDKYYHLLEFINDFNQNKNVSDDNLLVNMFVIINMTEKCHENIDKIKQNCQYVHLMPIQNTYIYRYMYWYTKNNLKNNLNYDIDLHDVNNEIKMLVGNVCFKNKISNLDLDDKIKLLFDEYDLENIYIQQMEENEYSLLTKNIEDYVDMSYHNIVLNGLRKTFENIKNNNISLNEKNILIQNLVEIIDENKYIYDEFIDYLTNNYVDKLKNNIELNSLTYDDINSINLVNEKIIDKWNVNIFENSDILININSTKTFMIIEKFKTTFDFKLIDELKKTNDDTLINLSIINESILYNISSWSFENYLNYTELIVKYFYNIDYLAHCVKYVKHFINQNILNDYMALKDNRQCNYIEFIINSYDYKLKNKLESYTEYSDDVDKIIQFNIHINKLFQYVIKKNNKTEETKLECNKLECNKLECNKLECNKLDETKITIKTTTKSTTKKLAKQLDINNSV
jgi:hypothetical protein